MSKTSVKSVFEYKSYRDYLVARLSTRGPTRGLRAQWAAQIKTQPAFVTQVLQGKIELGPEHIPPTNYFLEHTKDEAHFFTLLVLHERAGTKDLKEYYAEQIAEVLEERKQALENTREKNVLSLVDQAVYYSQWYYSAIRLLVSIPKYQTRAAISERLRLPLTIVTAAVETLLKLGLVSEANGVLNVREKHIQLKKDSPYRTQLHTHYRNRAIHSLSNPDARDYHTSILMGISYEGYEKLRKAIGDFINEQRPLLQEPKEEEGFVLTIDLFRLL